MTTTAPTFTVTATARDAYDNTGYDVRHGALLVGHGTYTETAITPAGMVRFVLSTGDAVDLAPRTLVTIRIDV